VSSEEIQELKAAFTKTSDNDEEIEVGDKARLVQEIITEGVKGRNLKGADLSRTDLSGADLSDAVVENTQFGANLGLTEEMKLDLKKRGAISENWHW
jgi:uncharacterized protein YjbI with pentapeptide repeats